MHTTRIVSFPLGLLSCAMMEQFTQVMIFLEKYQFKIIRKICAFHIFYRMMSKIEPQGKIIYFIDIIIAK